MKKQWNQFAVIAAFLGVAGIFYLSNNTFPSVAAGGDEPFPDFSMQTVTGKTWRLSQQRGKIVLLNYWATWCPPCREETPELVQLSDEYKNRGVIVAGVSMDGDDRAAVHKFVKQFGVRYPVLFPQPDSPLVDSIDMLPTSFLLDAQGRQVKAYLGRIPMRVLKTDIDALLQQQTAQPQTEKSGS